MLQNDLLQALQDAIDIKDLVLGCRIILTDTIGLTFQNHEIPVTPDDV
jgi:hypothetical protein